MWWRWLRGWLWRRLRRLRQLARWDRPFIPMSSLMRDRGFFGRKARGFTLQWHLTNRCGFNCRHCYDRSARAELELSEALTVTADLQGFCRRHRVQSQASLSGGDPFLYPHFWEVYAALVSAGVRVSILGNPISSADLQRLLSCRPPSYYQISLEGLREHNDDIRGPGHFDHTMEFLKMARHLGLETHVMLTLTRANLDQVIPLGTALRGLTARFTFNRLAPVGRGAELQAPAPADFVRYLHDYLAACRANPILGLKDNLFNIIRHRHGRSLWPGCTGHGCGAAFNFVALLPDGEVHACRKYPSVIGHIREANLMSIYDSAAAARYRAGPLACRNCVLRNHCGGCPAVVAGLGLDPFRDLDPYCFIDS